MAKTEILARRTLYSKGFDLGNGQRQISVSPGPIHFLDTADALLKDLVLDFDASRQINQAPYQLEVDADQIGVRYTSRASGEVWTCRLVAVGGTPISSLPLVVNPVRQGRQIVWANCLPGLSIKLLAKPTGVAFIKELADDTVPRSFAWRIARPSTSVGVKLTDLVGRDNVPYTRGGSRGFTEQRSFPLELTLDTQLLSDDGTTRVDRVTETWTGRIIKVSGPATDVVYPVEFDPSFQEAITAAGDDGRESPVGTWNSTDASSINVGNYYGTTSHGGFRFSAVGDGSGPNSGDTISVATLTLSSAYHGGANDDWDIYADNVDNAAAWSAGSYPSNITNTTARSDYNGAGTGTIVLTITSVVAEIVARSGWAQGNAMRFGVLNQSGSNAFDQIYPYESASQEARLDITYTAGAAALPLMGQIWQ